MAFLRRISTRQLILLVAAVAAVVIGGTALALAAGSGAGPKPAPKPLANAIHDALNGPSAQGVTAQVKFTNNLIDSANIQGSDPLLSGSSGRLWAAPGGRFRVELQADSGQDAQVVSDGSSFWAYDPSSNTVYRGSLPQHKQGARDNHQPPTLAKIQQALSRLAQHANVSGATPDNVGGQEAYDVRVSPKQSGGLFGGVGLAFDAARAVPLRIGLYARGQDSPVAELSVTDISFGSVSSSDISIPPPHGAKTVDLNTQQRGDRGKKPVEKPVTGLSAVQAKLPFKVAAPGALGSRNRSEVKLLGSGGALVTYGQGPGSIAVIERAAKAGAAAPKPSGGEGDHRQGLSLPAVSINGATGQELATAIGTVVTFDRGGVSYTVLGSVNSAAALAAARGL
jgi:outer membrane lipoprotein-sorting protein